MRELIEYRKKNKLTQKRLAEMIGIRQPSLCDIEKGRRNPSPKTALKIEAVTGIDARLLIFSLREC